MPNLVKQRFVVENKEQTRVIDSNERMERLIGRPGKEGFTPGLFAKQVDIVAEDSQEEEFPGMEALMADRDDPEAEPVAKQEPDMEALEQYREEAQEILNQANEQAQEILADARLTAQQEAESIKQQAYEQGCQQAQEEIENLKIQQQEEYQALADQQAVDYEKRLQEMEPDLVDSILSVVQEVLHVQIEDYRPVILDLVGQTMMQAENPKEISIFANEANCAYLKEYSDRLRAIAGEETKLEILINQQLSEEDCRIETEYGVYDCGFDIQLKNLSNRIRLLSHQKE